MDDVFEEDIAGLLGPAFEVALLVKSTAAAEQYKLHARRNVMVKAVCTFESPCGPAFLAF
jgi:hypothetical protein